jgi:hypothetical protein
VYHPSTKAYLNAWFLLEFVMQMITPIPYYDKYVTFKVNRLYEVHYFMSEIMLSIMAFRLFSLARVYFNYSVYNDFYSKKLFQ